MKAIRILVRITNGRPFSDQFRPHYFVSREGLVSQTSDVTQPTFGGLKGTGLNGTSLFVFLENAGRCYKSEMDGRMRSAYGELVDETRVVDGIESLTKEQVAALERLARDHDLPLEQSPGDVLAPELELAYASSAGPWSRTSEPADISPAPSSDNESLWRLSRALDQ